jgi:hypothetical protein
MEDKTIFYTDCELPKCLEELVLFDKNKANKKIHNILLNKKQNILSGGI